MQTMPCNNKIQVFLYGVMKNGYKYCMKSDINPYG